MAPSRPGSARTTTLSQPRPWSRPRYGHLRRPLVRAGIRPSRRPTGRSSDRSSSARHSHRWMQRRVPPATSESTVPSGSPPRPGSATPRSAGRSSRELPPRPPPTNGVALDRSRRGGHRVCVGGGDSAVVIVTTGHRRPMSFRHASGSRRPRRRLLRSATSPGVGPIDQRAVGRPRRAGSRWRQASPGRGRSASSLAPSRRRRRWPRRSPPSSPATAPTDRGRSR